MPKDYATPKERFLEYKASAPEGGHELPFDEWCEEFIDPRTARWTGFKKIARDFGVRESRLTQLYIQLDIHFTAFPKSAGPPT